jgi:aspartyl-tRNA synthetase
MSRANKTSEELKEDFLKSRVEELEAENEALKDPSVSDSQTPTIPEQTFEVEGAHYRFLVPSFWLNGEFYTAQEALESPMTLAILVERKVAIIKKA